MPPPLALVLALALALLASMASAELLLVYSIQRHGARDVLPKSSVSFRRVYDPACKHIPQLVFGCARAVRGRRWNV